MQEAIFLVIRHALTFGGGLLVKTGLIGASDVDVFVGAVATIVGLVWSAIQKAKALKKLKAAAAAEPFVL